jgi:hypothetical protein
MTTSPFGPRSPSPKPLPEFVDANIVDQPTLVNDADQDSLWNEWARLTGYPDILYVDTVFDPIL